MIENPNRLSSFLAELRRRHVVRAVIGYGAVVFVVLQAADLGVSAELLSPGAFRLLALGALLLFPVIVALGWIFDLTPEGIRRVSNATGDRLVTRRVKPWAVYGTLATLVVAALGLIVALYPRGASSAEVARGADVIAVLPFDARGEGMEVMAEGMVDLLSRNLDEVGAIRTVDPRTVLYRWEQRARNGRVLSLEEALEVGREVQAGSVLIGSAVAVGSSVRLSAELYAIDGGRLAAVRADGASDAVLALVDTLSIDLLREIWRSSRPFPRMDVGALTSNNLEAIRAFLEGERHYRASRWDEALSSFARAVSADGLFALAHYRLAATASWIRGSEGADIGRRSARLARQFSDSLPVRERLLVVAQDLAESGRRTEAVDTLREFLRRFPDDAEGWFALADAEYHLLDESAGPTRRPAEEQLRLFDRALALDPSFSPAVIHPLEIAAVARDTVLMRRYVDLLDRTAADPGGVAVYRAAVDALRQPRDPERLAGALTTLLATSDTAPTNLVNRVANAVTSPLLATAAVLPPADRRRVVDHIRAEIQTGTGGGDGLRLLAHLLLAGGRVADARELLASPEARLRGGVDLARRFDRLPTYAGFSDGGLDLEETYGVAPRPLPRLAAGLLGAIDRADAAGTLEAVRRLRADPAHDDSAGAEQLARVGAGFARLIQGDTVAALGEIERALAAPPGLGRDGIAEALWLRWLERLAGHRRTRERALELLRRPWFGDPVFEPLAHLVLARALAAHGDDDGALAAYTRVLDALADADPVLRVRPALDEARAALGR